MQKCIERKENNLSIELKDYIVKLVDDKFGQNINVIDFEQTNPFTDYFVICDVDSSRQIEGIVHEIVKQDKENKLDLRVIDGQADSGWVVVDLHDVTLHIFSKEMREHYELDKLFLNHPQSMRTDVQ